MSFADVAIAVVFVAVTLGVGTVRADTWTPVLEDNFDREMLGPNWRVLRGDWRIEDGRLRVTRAWPSDSVIISTITMPRGDMRCEIKLVLEEDCGFLAFLRSGEHFWGGGGYPDAFGGVVSAPKQPKTKEDKHIAPNKVCTLEIQIENGIGTVCKNGKEIVRKTVGKARSEANRSLYINCMPNGWVESVKLFTKSGQSLALPIEKNTPEENKQATVNAKDFIDQKNPALGMQKAIDSLPPNGGVVILPVGEFVMRRHLFLRSGVTLRGQGYDKTILQAAPIHSTKVTELEQADGHCTVTVEDASKFLVGDGICFGRSWGHVGMSDIDMPGRNHSITAIKGNAITISGVAPKKSKSIQSFFPLIYSIVAEFVEVKDLTLRGPSDPGDAGGGFNTCPVAFGCILGARITRINIEKYPADGISVQGAADALVTDNTVTGTQKGFHPGTRTQRWLWGRNHSIGNATGLYFCFSNENGIYYRSTVDDFTGYPGVGDVFNTLVGNDSSRPIYIEPGYGGLFVNNKIPALIACETEMEPGRPMYFSAARYYVFGENQATNVTLGSGARGNIVAGTIPLLKAVEFKGDTKENLYSSEAVGLVKRLNLPVGAGRTKPVAAPALRAPVLDGCKYYQPHKPDCGFQKAIDELVTKGGSLLLPAGRYPLGTPLSVPSNVTLAGQGIGTLLYAADDNENGALVVSANAKNVTIRDLTVLGRYDTDQERGPAIAIKSVENARIEQVDIRGWEGAGIDAADAGITVENCRAFGCVGDGFSFARSLVQVHTSLARGCQRGFVLQQAGKNSLVAGNIASGNRESGFVLAQAKDPLVYGNSSTFNGIAGILLSDIEGGVAVGNTCRGNDQRLNKSAGIYLAGATTRFEVLYNLCTDDQIHASQASGVKEDPTTTKNIIRFNICCPTYMMHQEKKTESLIALGKGSTVDNNLVESSEPSGSSIESRGVGFFGTPHSHNMKKGARRNARKSLEGRLKNAISSAEKAKQRIEVLTEQLKALEQQAKPNTKKIEAGKLKMQRDEKDRAKHEEASRNYERQLKKHDQEDLVAEQEKTVSYSKYQLLILRKQDAKRSQIRDATKVLKKDEAELAARQAALDAM